MALGDGESLIAAVELLKLSAYGATVERLGEKQHALLQRGEAGQPPATPLSALV
jgi:hypothetical protein